MRTTLLLAVLTAIAAEEAPIVIDPAKPLHELPALFNGSNFVALWNPVGASPEACTAVGRLGLGGLRFPGGVPCQWYDWENPTASEFTTITTDDAWRLATAAGAQLVLQTNTATTKEDKAKKSGNTYRLDASPEHQVGWLEYCRKQGITVAVWEIGNEPEMDAPDGIKGDDQRVFDWYNEVYGKQAAALRAADPKARLAGPASTNTWFWWHQDNIGRFLKAHGNRTGDGLADIVSLHWYVEGSEKWEDRRGAAQGWEAANAFIRKSIATHDTRDLPVMISEWNWGAGMNTIIARQMASGLGNADIVGMFRRTGVYAQQHFCLQKIDHGWGILGMDKDSRPVNRPSPTFFALALAGRMGRSVLALTNPADEKAVLSAYAAADDKGGIQVLLINKSDAERTVPLSIAGRSAAAATIHVLQGSGGALSDEKVTLNGVEDPDPAASPLPEGKPLAAGAPVVVPKYALALVEFAPPAKPAVQAKPAKPLTPPKSAPKGK